LKIDKALIIRRLQVPLSMEYAQICAESCEKYNLPYEFIDAVEFLNCKKAFQSVGTYKNGNYHIRDGNCCCHASHIKCWKRIIELNKACIILEHDAVVKGNVCNIDIPDMATVTFGHRVGSIDDYSPPEEAYKLVRIKRSLGVHACGLTPISAKWLWEHARDNGVKAEVDHLLMMRPPTLLPLYVCEPPQVVCWERVSTSKFTKDNHIDDRPNETIKVFPESITEGWKKGKKI